MSALVLFDPNAMPNTTAYKSELMAGEFTLRPGQQLLPPSALNGIIQEQNAHLIPADKETKIDAAQFLVGSYPVSQLKEPEIFLRSLNMLLDGYPADILRIGMIELIKTNKWLPSIAEVTEKLDRLKFARSAVKSRAENQLKEHEKRRMK